MYNLVCLEEENPWLGLVDVPLLNRRLARKRGAFERMVLPPASQSVLPPPGRMRIGRERNRSAYAVSGNRPL